MSDTRELPERVYVTRYDDGEMGGPWVDGPAGDHEVPYVRADAEEVNPITWDDVDNIREAVDVIESEWGAVDYGTASLLIPLRDLANRLEARLPPREDDQP